MSSPGRESSCHCSWLTLQAGGVFTPFLCLLPSGSLNSPAVSTTAAVSPSQDWLCSSQKNDCLHRAVYERSPCQNPVSGELFVIAFPSDVLLKSFLLEQLMLFQCGVVILACNHWERKMASLQEWHVMYIVYSCKLGQALGWGGNETWQGISSGTGCRYMSNIALGDPSLQDTSELY